MNIVDFIPPNSSSVLEISNNIINQEKFLLINPQCKYIVTVNSIDIKDKYDTVIVYPLKISLQYLSYLKKLVNTTLVMIISKEDFQQLQIIGQQVNLNIFRTVNIIFKNTERIIILANFQKAIDKILLQYMCGERLVCAPLRVHLPNSFLATRPDIVTLASYDYNNYQLYTRYKKKVFINQRLINNSFEEGKTISDHIRSNGYLYISEIDDHPIFYKEKYDKSEYINFLSVHAIQTSTDYLADYLKQYNPYIKVFPNYLRSLLPKRDYIEEYKSGKPVTIFFGALNRNYEFLKILPILNELIKQYNDKLFFNIIAHDDVTKHLRTKNKKLIGKSNIYCGQIASYGQYVQALYESDIALLPLLDNEFNRSKSDLKYLESASAGSVVVASPVVYSNTIKDGETGFIAFNLEDFKQKLQILIDNNELRWQLAENAYNYVKYNRLMYNHYEERLDWYNELLAKWSFLNQEVENRLAKYRKD